MRRYVDSVEGKEMLLRVVLEDAADHVIVVTAYKTSNLGRYLKGIDP